MCSSASNLFDSSIHHNFAYKLYVKLQPSRKWSCTSRAHLAFVGRRWNPTNDEIIKMEFGFTLFNWFDWIILTGLVKMTRPSRMPSRKRIWIHCSFLYGTKSGDTSSIWSMNINSGFVLLLSVCNSSLHFDREKLQQNKQKTCNRGSRWCVFRIQHTFYIFFVCYSHAWLWIPTCLDRVWRIWFATPTQMHRQVF